MKKNLIIIAGPTAVGKTALSIELAKFYNCPIISADSRQFYKEMSIGTAKPTKEEMQDVPHYFIDNISIHDTYNVGQFEREAIECIETLFKEHEQLILVGGSGLYINAILNGVDEFEEIPSHIREQLIKDYEEKGLTYLQEQLKQLDEVYYNQVDLNNPQRIMRALEVCIHTQKPYSSFRTKEKKQRSFDAINILINTDREALYTRINKRVDVMMQNGLLEEVQALYPYKHLNALNTVGYKEIFDFIDNKCTLEEAVNLIKQNSRRYAKRQLTWFNHQGDFETFAPTDLEKLKAYLDIVTQFS
ncbi:MAG: tRNA (adenosine(37)-N6)-dimethylallyltransferase MiaA [Sphingobacteriaceae bacterium]|nr:tRNA (adenosine(37)-N6)-dimethylallyltransferase MiaA [Sphingobacteriaceae bacterium]